MESFDLSVLLIEDDPDHAELIQGFLDILQDHPVSWVWADTLAKGIELLQGEQRFNAILCDLSLPDSPLPETVLRLAPHAIGAPIIVLTALNDVDVALQAVREGAQDYLVKTQLSSELLFRTIRHAVERSRHVAELAQMNGLLRDEVGERRQLEEALRAINDTLELAVTERTRDLEQANRTLAARNQELEEFAHAASHDLQEPLRKVATFASLLEAEHQAQLDAEGRQHVARVQSAAARMSKLLSDLLIFSRVMTKAVPFTKVDLNDTFSAVLTDLAIQLRESGGEVVLSEPLPWVEADPVQMQQLLLNLVDNGLKFQNRARKGETPLVRVSGSTEVASGLPVVKLVVEDNGIGFDVKYVDRIFMPFQRLHNKGTYEGTGIGLAVCRRIVERHGGEIRVESTPGRGSRFTVLLPQRERPSAEHMDQQAVAAL